MLDFRCESIELVDKLFKTLLLPSLEYAAAVWDSCSKAESESLEKLQFSVARAVLSNNQKYIMKTRISFNACTGLLCLGDVGD